MFKQKLGLEFRPNTILGACNLSLAHRALSHSALVELMHEARSRQKRVAAALRSR